MNLLEIWLCFRRWAKHWTEFVRSAFVRCHFTPLDVAILWDDFDALFYVVDRWDVLLIKFIGVVDVEGAMVEMFVKFIVIIVHCCMEHREWVRVGDVHAVDVRRNGTRFDIYTCFCFLFHLFFVRCRVKCCLCRKSIYRSPRAQNGYLMLSMLGIFFLVFRRLDVDMVMTYRRIFITSANAQ